MNRWALLAALTLVASGCTSRLQSRWVPKGYDASALDATKRIAIVAWAENEELARLTARIATERVKFKKNYLVYGEGLVNPGWASGCTRDEETLEGVLVVRLLDVVREDSDVTMGVEGRLMRCSDGALLWRAEVQGSGDADDQDLATFAESYQEEFPEQAEKMAIPLLVNLIALLDALPDVVLTEDEEITKLELS